MKKLILIIAFITSISTITLAQKAPNLDIEKSTVNWSGAYTFGFGGHEGIVKIKSGELIKKDGRITGGAFILDMNTIANTDGDYSQDLVDHLKSADFFDVENHPTAKFNITKVKYHDPNNTRFSDSIYLRITGDLTIKNITHNIWYEAEINAANTELLAKLKIDRTLWNVNFKSKSLGSKLKDGIISDAIEFHIALKLN